MASIITILSLNTNKRADLAGLLTILKENKPHLVFLQEILSYNAVSAAASASGFSLWTSTLPGVRMDRTVAVLSRLPATTVQEMEPGHSQLVTVGGLSFLHVHAPNERTERNTFYLSLRPSISTSTPISPILVGDFNTCQHDLDTSSGLLFHGQRCPHLAAILNDFSYSDSFRTLHPTAKAFSFHRQSFAFSRLDRAYLPPLLESRPRVARFIPTSSDHHAYLLRLEMAGLALLPSFPSSPSSSSLYWKFNSSLLSDPRFLPAFRRMWGPLADGRPLPPPDGRPLDGPPPGGVPPVGPMPQPAHPPPGLPPDPPMDQPPPLCPLRPPDGRFPADRPPDGRLPHGRLLQTPSLPLHPPLAPPLDQPPPLLPLDPLLSLRPPASSSTRLPGGHSAIGAVVAAWEDVPGAGAGAHQYRQEQEVAVGEEAAAPARHEQEVAVREEAAAHGPILPLPAASTPRPTPTLTVPMVIPPFPPFTPVYHPPPLSQARPGRLGRLGLPANLNPLAPAFVPSQRGHNLPPATPPIPDPLPAPPLPAAADWWEETAKPAVISFCQSFAISAATSRFHLRRLVCRALEIGLAEGDWPSVAAARKRLHALDAAAAAGLAVRTHTPLADDELPDVFHAQVEARHGPSTGLCAVRTEDGTVLTAPADVEAEVSRFFEALFHGRHVASAAASGPVDSGSTFQPNPDLFPGLLNGLPSLSADQQAVLELPFTLPELEAAVEAAAPSKAPGLDGLSYEFYQSTLDYVGPALLDALNAMLTRGLLSPSLRQGVVRLLPKVPGVPLASQLRPITLLCTDYKLLTKMMVTRLLPLLPTVLCATQLCSVRGRSIHDGPASVLSAAEYLQRRNLPGYLLSLDFFHAFDRVSMDWVDRVLEAMGFGLIFRGWIGTLHRGASASFLLQSLSPALAILFSIRQGDPLASLIFILYMEPFLVQLEASLRGLRMAGIREASFSYMDDVEVLGNEMRDILTTDSLCRNFEAASGAILNRNRKTVIIGLGSWAGRLDWPLAWLQAAASVKVLGFNITPSFKETVQLSWDQTLAGMERTLRSWRSRRLLTLAQRVQVLEEFILSKAWYLAHLLPLATEAAGPPHMVAPATRLRRLVCDFLWAGRLRSIAFDETHSKRSAGGLGLSDPQTRAQSMLAKQACRHLAAAGRPALHLAFWIGPSLSAFLPDMPFDGPAVVGRPPPQYENLLDLLVEVFDLESVNVGRLQEVQSAAIYKELTSTLPTPLVQRARPDLPWDLAWLRLTGPCLDAIAVDTHFSVLHNLLDVMANKHHWRVAPSPNCPRCRPPGPPETILHFFTACERVSASWHFLFFRASIALGVTLTDESLLLLAWPSKTARADAAVVLAITTFTAWAWSTRDLPDVLAPPDLRARVRVAAAPGLLYSIL